MPRVRAFGVLLASLALLGLSMADARAQVSEASSTVLSLKLNGVVDPFVAPYVERGISQAEADGDAAVLLTIDTPGGLDSSMRTIVKAILNSHVPVICYTAPSGARAASAGAFIMLACPVNAMAPGTNIGAAHPVGVSGVIEQEKVTNDAAAYIRSLAERWDRNADWAEQAVRESVSISAEEAVSLKVVDLIAPSQQALLEQVDGRSVVLADGIQATIRTASATIETRGLGLGATILHALINPNLAFLFFYLGLGLLVIELLHPGITVPGILGTLFLVTAFIDFGLLPVQLSGVILLIASAVFFLLELKHPGFGLPTLGGVLSLLLGGLLLFNSSVPNARVSPWVLVVVAVALTMFFGVVVSAVVRARHLPRQSGLEGFAGEEGVAVDDLDPLGRVRVRRESWSAESAGGKIPAGTTVRVKAVEGLRLIVEPISAAAKPQESTQETPQESPQASSR